MKNREGSKVTLTILMIVLIIAVILTLVITALGLLGEDGASFDKERKGVLTELTFVEGESRMVMVGKVLTERQDPNTYIVKFDHQFRYEVTEEIGNQLERGMTYSYRPEINGSQVMISVPK